MGVKLGDMVVDRGLVTADELEEALHAQRQLGGRLGSNLVELGFVTEEQIASCLSEQLGIPFVPAETVATLSPDLVRRIPTDIAARFRVVPLRMEGLELHVGLADPHDLGRVDELSLALRCTVRPHVVTEVTLNYALERYYKIKREPRFLRGPDRNVTFLDFVEDEPTVKGGPDSPPRAVRPATLEELIERLVFAVTEAHVAEATARLLAHVFDEVAVFDVRGARVRGIFAAKRAAFLRTIDAVDVPLVEGSLVAESARRGKIAFRDRLEDPALARICDRLGLRTRQITVMPLSDADGPVFVAVGQGVDEATLRAGLGRLKRVLGKISSALKILALRAEIRTPVDVPGSWID